MKTQLIVRVGSLDEFLGEVPPGTARLSLVDREAGGGGSIPMKSVELHLQGFNDLGELVWLMDSHRIHWLDGRPWMPRDKSIAACMSEAKRLVLAYLEGLGYEVRAGSYGIPDDVKPVRGRFDCVSWRKVSEEEYEVLAADGLENEDG